VYGENERVMGRNRGLDDLFWEDVVGRSRAIELRLQQAAAHHGKRIEKIVLSFRGTSGRM
jgi:hypothetical protein